MNSVGSGEMPYLTHFVWFTVTWKKSKERKGPPDVGFIAVYFWKYPEKSCKLGQESGLNYLILDQLIELGLVQDCY